jgi:hypothetical protein
MIPAPDDDHAKKAVILIDKLTVALGDLRQQVEANAQATASLSKLNQDLQQKIDALRLPTPSAPRTQPPAASKTDLDDFASRIEDRILGLHARYYALLAVSVIGVLIAAGMSVRIFL